MDPTANIRTSPSPAHPSVPLPASVAMPGRSAPRAAAHTPAAASQAATPRVPALPSPPRGALSLPLPLVAMAPPGPRVLGARQPMVPAWRAHVTPMLDAAAIAGRVQALGASITQDYATRAEEGLVVMGVLVGACLFHTDLMRSIDLPITCDFVRLSSYGHATQSSGEVAMKIPPQTNIAGKHVLVVEDIVDTGLSMKFLLAALRKLQPASIEVCTLLTKPSRREVPVDAKYVGFEVPDKFVVGYGLDAAGRYRNLPFIGVLNAP